MKSAVGVVANDGDSCEDGANESEKSRRRRTTKEGGGGGGLWGRSEGL